MGRRSNAQIAADRAVTITREELLHAALAFVNVTGATIDSRLDHTDPAELRSHMDLLAAAKEYRAALSATQEMQRRGQPSAAS